MHNRANILRDRVVDPAKDALIEHGPIGITMICRSGRCGEVVGEAEFPDDSIEEAPPLGIVGFLEIEFDQNVVTNVHGLENGG
jgi:hypothetical protein